MLDTALHEFGHAVGLVHEQEHSKSTCWFRGYGMPDGLVKKITPFDSRSIMNYCTMMAEKGNGYHLYNPEYNSTTFGFSEGDIETIEKAYGHL